MMEYIVVMTLIRKKALKKANKVNIGWTLNWQMALPLFLYRISPIKQKPKDRSIGHLRVWPCVFLMVNNTIGQNMYRDEIQSPSCLLSYFNRILDEFCWFWCMFHTRVSVGVMYIKGRWFWQSLASKQKLFCSNRVCCFARLQNKGSFERTGSVVLPDTGFKTEALLNEQCRLYCPRIDSNESIPPAYVAWRAITSNRVLVLARQAGNRFLGPLKVYKFGLSWNFIFRSSLCSKCCCRSSLSSSISDIGRPFSRTIYSRITESCLINHKTEQKKQTNINALWCHRNVSHYYICSRE